MHKHLITILSDCLCCDAKNTVTFGSFSAALFSEIKDYYPVRPQKNNQLGSYILYTSTKKRTVVRGFLRRMGMKSRPDTFSEKSKADI